MHSGAQAPRQQDASVGARAQRLRQPAASQAYTAAPAPPPPQSAAPAAPWFASWGPSHTVGVFLGFCVLMLSAAIFAVINMFQPVLKVRQRGV